MKENFDKAIEFVLAREGGYVHDSADPGGETNFGISKRAYPNEDIKNMTRERAIKLYRDDYWEKWGCDKLEWPYDIMVFDTAVNNGPAFAKKSLSQSQNWLDFLMHRLRHYTNLNTFNHFGRGWTRRIIDLYFYIRERG